MNEIKNEKSWNTLYDKYPDLFINRNKSPRESCMSFGVECNLGWYELISSVCWRVSQHQKNIEDRKRILADQPERIKEELEYVPVKFDQVKEKYGGLRLYFSGGDDYVDGIVSMAEEYSYKVCEKCGNSGKPNKDGWITTLCENCRNKS
ncbi:hypothetical protein EB001_13455 [bacterium]|nr:hypothetical protein [bacterium]